MPDPRFFPKPEPRSVADIASAFGLEVAGDGAVMIAGAAPLALAGASDISFVAGKKHLAEAETSGAGALVVPRDLASRLGGRAVLVSGAPQRDFAAIARSMYPDPENGAQSVPVHPDAKVDASAIVAPTAVIGPCAEIGAGSEVGPGAVIGPGVVLGQQCRIGANVVVSHAILGDRVRIFPGAAIGQPGFGYVPGPAGLEAIPQLGRVIIGDDVDIGTNTTIDRGAGGDTVIGSGTKIDNQVQIAHNCQIGSHCVLAAHVGISGSVTIGNFVQMGGKVGVADHLTIGDGAKLAGGSGVIKDVPAGETQGGYPARPVRDWHRQTVAVARWSKPAKR